eukprot:105850-Rhodomonas_salina.2
MTNLGSYEFLSSKTCLRDAFCAVHPPTLKKRHSTSLETSSCLLPLLLVFLLPTLSEDISNITPPTCLLLLLLLLLPSLLQFKAKGNELFRLDKFADAAEQVFLPPPPPLALLLSSRARFLHTPSLFARAPAKRANTAVRPRDDANTHVPYAPFTLALPDDTLTGASVAFSSLLPPLPPPLHPPHPPPYPPPPSRGSSTARRSRQTPPRAPSTGHVPYLPTRCYNHVPYQLLLTRALSAYHLATRCLA